jgi:hypothetical protein
MVLRYSRVLFEEVSPKTKKGYKVVNIEPALVEMLTAHLCGRKA